MDGSPPCLPPAEGNLDPDRHHVHQGGSTSITPLRNRHRLNYCYYFNEFRQTKNNSGTGPLRLTATTFLFEEENVYGDTSPTSRHPATKRPYASQRLSGPGRLSLCLYLNLSQPRVSPTLQLGPPFCGEGDLGRFSKGDTTFSSVPGTGTSWTSTTADTHYHSSNPK